MKNLTVPGLDLRIALGRVRDDVMEMTRNRQEPFVYGSLGGSTVSLVPEAAKSAAAPAADQNADARPDYELASQVGTREAWDSFLALHGAGFYADLARGQRAKLNADIATAPTRTTPATPNAAPTSTTATLAASPPAPKPPATAVTAVVPPLEGAKPAAGSAETAKLMHVELQRLGCYPGAVDASWGPDSRRAMELFNKSAGANLDAKVAALDTLDVLRAKPARVCPLECKPGYRSENEACVKTACRSGFVANEKRRLRTGAEGQDRLAARRPRGETGRAAPAGRRAAASANRVRHERLPQCQARLSIADGGRRQRSGRGGNLRQVAGTRTAIPSAPSSRHLSESFRQIVARNFGCPKDAPFMPKKAVT